MGDGRNALLLAEKGFEVTGLMIIEGQGSEHTRDGPPPHRTSRVISSILPVNRVSGPMPIPSATGV